MQFRVLPDFFVRDKLRRITLLDRRGNFREIATRVVVYFDLDPRVAGNIDGVVLAQLKRFAVGADAGVAVQTDQTGLVIVVAKLQRGIARIQRDASVMQITRSRRPRRHRGAASVSFMCAGHKTSFGRNRILF